jgi:hypothetical protein
MDGSLAGFQALQRANGLNLYEAIVAEALDVAAEVRMGQGRLRLEALDEKDAADQVADPAVSVEVSDLDRWVSASAKMNTKSSLRLSRRSDNRV